MKLANTLAVAACAAIVASTTSAHALRTVKGVVKDIAGKPVAGLKVKVLDSDGLNNDDYMGSGTTDKNGRYSVRYRPGKWDSSAGHGHTVWRPDIYIRVYAPGPGGLGEVYKSKPKKDHRVRYDLTRNAVVGTMNPRERYTKFDVRQHGYRFQNRAQACKLPGCVLPCAMAPGPLRAPCFAAQKTMKTIAGGSWGVCGGMSLGALRGFNRGTPLTTATTPNAGIKDQLLAYQFDALLPGTLIRVVDYHLAPNKPRKGAAGLTASHTIGYRTRIQWEKKLQPRIDAGKPVLVTVLRRMKNRGLHNISNNHQVLVTGYKSIGLTREIYLRLYDPNHPGRVSWMSYRFGMPERDLHGYQWVCSEQSAAQKKANPSGWCERSKGTAEKRPRGFLVNDRQG